MKRLVVIVLVLLFTSNGFAVFFNSQGLSIHKDLSVKDGRFEHEFYLPTSKNVQIALINNKGSKLSEIEITTPSGELISSLNFNPDNSNFKNAAPRTLFGEIEQAKGSWFVGLKKVVPGKYKLTGTSSSDALIPMSLIVYDSPLGTHLVFGDKEPRSDYDPEKQIIINEELPFKFNLVTSDTAHYYIKLEVKLDISKDGKSISTIKAKDISKQNDDIGFHASFIPEQSGNYDMVVSYVGVDFNQEKFEGEFKTGFRVYDVMPVMNGIYLEETLDTNKNGYFDELKLIFPLYGNHPKSGEFKIYAEIQLGDEVIQDFGSIDASAGEIVAIFPAEKLRAANYSGEFKVNKIVAKYEGAVVYSFENLKNTNTYDNNVWERDQLIYMGNLTDQAIDIDGDGYYDGIKITYDIDSLVADVFTTGITVETEDGLHLDGKKFGRVSSITSYYEEFEEGLNTIELIIGAEKFVQLNKDTKIVIDSMLTHHQRKKISTKYIRDLGITKKYYCKDFAGCNNNVIAAKIEDKNIRPSGNSRPDYLNEQD